MEVNKIYNENCLDTLARMSDGFVDLTVTSPPYDNLRKYNGEMKWNDSVWKGVIKEIYRVTKKGGVVVWVVGDATIKGSETGTSFKQALYAKECGFNLHDTMIYKRRQIPLNHNRYETGFEYMFVFSKGKPKTFRPIMQINKPRKSSKNEGFHTQPNGCKKKISAGRKKESIKLNVWEYNVGYMNSSKDKCAFSHPAIFPEKLANDHIISWSSEGDLVYDPFMGSGTTAKMAIINKRNWIGSEISEEYFKIAEKRINENL